MDWKTIDSAPIDPFNADKWFMPHSPRLLLWLGNAAVIGNYGFTRKGKGRWSDWHGIINPTHWMELPEPPK